ncbi:mRNA-binding ribosome synthesis protein nop7 [Microbotryomycetes sp. JL201]|nr:mRNA-binding ribosome synthesis protein nop7 [Microbotryomycetes sp. JL201]
MARTGAMKKKGEAGAAKNYITRNQAIKKLQCTLGDFRRLCILKGIYPREPRNRKKANKGSSAPASFYYAKDIQYLLHEPVLAKLREHKAFAKKLSKAVGRGEWALAKNLEEYPTFTDALRDLDDALSLIVLFASLPATSTIPSSIIANCARLAAQWQLYVMRTKSLRKVFLSIKGIYFQAEVQGQTITWLVPYMFTQNIPSDLDFRIMMTFLELYQTLLGFVFFKLYTDINLVYPPKLDEVLDENGAGIGALLLEEAGQGLVVMKNESEEDKERKRVYAKDVRKQIREIEQQETAGTSEAAAEDEAMNEDGVATARQAEQVELDVFPSNGADGEDDMQQPDRATATLFQGYYFFLSREVTRPTLEFVIRSFGGQVGWDPILGAGSPYDENDARITHHVVDRPVVPGQAPRSHPGKRAYIQPQWVVDCVNKRTLLPTDEYAPGAALPPHLSPFVDEDAVRERGGYVPMEARSSSNAAAAAAEDEAAEEDDNDESEEDGSDVEMDGDVDDRELAKNARPVVGQGKKNKPTAPALLAAAKNPENESLRHAAELEAEARGVAPDQFEKELAAETKKHRKTPVTKGSAAKRSKEQEEQLASIMLTGKQKKLYNKMSYSAEKRKAEAAKLEQRRKDIIKARAKSQKSGL